MTVVKIKAFRDHPYTELEVKTAKGSLIENNEILQQLEIDLLLAKDVETAEKVRDKIATIEYRNELLTEIIEGIL